jgi:predicted  nucleic acid-binding Zn-ribbon protein
MCEQKLREGQNKLDHLEQRLDPLNRQLHEKQRTFNEKSNLYKKLNSDMEICKAKKAAIDEQIENVNQQEMSKQSDVRKQSRILKSQEYNLSQLNDKSNQTVDHNKNSKYMYKLHENQNQTQKQFNK